MGIGCIWFTDHVLCLKGGERMALRSLIGRRRYEHWTGEGDRYRGLRRERAKRYDISESLARIIHTVMGITFVDIDK